MGVPTITTTGWRLPPKAHSAPEASFTDDMYQAKGLPVDTNRAPTTGGSGLPTANTDDWRLPSTEQRLAEAKKRDHRKPFEVDLDDGQFVDLKGNYKDADFDGLDDRTGAPMPKKRKAAVESRCGGGKPSFLKRKKRQAAGPPRAADNEAVDEAVEDPRSAQRRLAGLTESKHLEFATGTPHRRMPSAEIPSYLAEHHELTEASGVTIPKKLLSKIDGWSFELSIERIFQKARRGPLQKQDLLKVIKSLEYEIKAMQPSEAQDKKKFTWLLNAVKDLTHGTGRGENTVPTEQQALAGMTERVSLPHPMTDTRPVGARPSHGILDDGMDEGEAFVDQVLQESRWFFEDFGGPGAKRPFDEAPGGRAGPWRGSDDEPAKTPVVRQGKVKGAVGDEPEPEDDDEGEDQKRVPPKSKGKGKPKAPPEEEPEEDDEGEEPEEQDEGILKKFGAKVRGAGERIKSGKHAVAAKGRLHKHLQRFAKKHGIKAFGHEPGEAKPKTKPKPLAKKPAKKNESTGIVSVSAPNIFL